jgi:hypothetical protein
VPKVGCYAQNHARVVFASLAVSWTPVVIFIRFFADAIAAQRITPRRLQGEGALDVIDDVIEVA